MRKQPSQAALFAEDFVNGSRRRALSSYADLMLTIPYYTGSYPVLFGLKTGNTVNSLLLGPVYLEVGDPRYVR